MTWLALILKIWPNLNAGKNKKSNCEMNIWPDSSTKSTNRVSSKNCLSALRNGYRQPQFFRVMQVAYTRIYRGLSEMCYMICKRDVENASFRAQMP